MAAFKTQQGKMARQLEKGERSLGEWPVAPDDVNMWRKPRQVEIRVARDGGARCVSRERAGHADNAVAGKEDWYTDGTEHT